MYLWSVAGPKWYLAAALLLAGIAGVVLEFRNYRGAEDISVELLLIQLFAVSVGFRGYAARGYLDPVLTSGLSRARIALLHFAVCAAPGFVAWCLLGMAEVLHTGTLSVTAFRPRGFAGFLVVSTISWALSLPLPPLASGSLWLLLSVAGIVFGRTVWITAARTQTRWFSEHPVQGIGLGLSLPIGIPTISWPWMSIVIFLLLSAAALGLGALYVARSEFTLAEPA